MAVWSTCPGLAAPPAPKLSCAPYLPTETLLLKLWLLAPATVAAISRTELSKRVVGNPEALRRLEALVHPLVVAEKRRWLAAQAAAGQQLVVLDIPLLYETGAEAQCDAVAVVSAPAEVQRQRALARPGMSEAKLDSILQRQVPDADKRRRADFVIDTVGGCPSCHVAVAGLTAATLDGGSAACVPLLMLAFSAGQETTFPAAALLLLLLSLQGVPLEESRQHVVSIVESLRGRPGSKYQELLAAEQPDT